MIVGAVANPIGWHRWEEAKALLEPARILADDMPEVMEENHVLWAIIDGADLLGVATARLTEDRCEVILVGGREHRRWLNELDTKIGAAAAEAGAARLAGWGRAGWWRTLRRAGWEKLGANGKTILFVRELGNNE